MIQPAGIYIHVPFCAQKCPYCDFYSGRYTKTDAERFTEAVCRNLTQLPEQLKADTVYFGGGTPSLLPAESLARMLSAVRARCVLAADAEITLEANPLTVTEQNLAAWLEAGINRLSLGVQSFQPDVLRMLGRRHTPQQAQNAVLRAAAAGFRNLSIDLMCGLDIQTAACWQADLAEAAALPVTHISSYLLKIEPQTPFGQQPPALADSDDTADRWLQMHDFLTAQGFRHYEISNYAKPGYESRHNCKYWQLVPYYGIGPAAHSCYDGKRYAVPRDLAAFCNAETQPAECTEPNACTESERIMLGLRLAEGIAFADVPASRDLLLHRAKPLIPQYLIYENDRLRMTPEGWLVSNAVLVRLLDGLNPE
ncbi:MAG: radical SAM family heme chaperone HemW [Oscillospiraceae bacterium]|nr:radical SAM family heme chaperone HemW [Oscillospiraceae bacterium]